MSAATLDCLTQMVRHGPNDFTVRQAAILSRIVSVDDEGRTVKALAAHFDVPKPVITRAADRLTEQGFVTRARDRMDLRLVFIRPTAAGLKFIAKVAS